MTTTTDREENRPAEENSPDLEDENDVEYEKALEEIGFGKAQLYQLIVTGLMYLSLNAISLIYGIISIASQCEFEMSQSDKGYMMAAMEAGKVLPLTIWGYISDKVGRRNVLLYTTYFSCLSLIISIFITNLWVFNAINFLVGISSSGILVVIPVYVGEFNRAKHRDGVLNFLYTLTAIGPIYSSASAWFALSFDWTLDLPFNITLRPWRLIILLIMMPMLIGILFLHPFPESPKYLLAQCKKQSAYEAIDWICRVNKGKSLSEAFRQTTILRLLPEEFPDNDVVIRNPESWRSRIMFWKQFRPFLSPPHRKNFFLCCTTIFLSMFSAYSLLVWYPELVNRVVEQGNNGSATMCDIIDASFKKATSNGTYELQTECTDEKISEKFYIDTLVLGCLYVAAYVLQGLILRYIGAKKILMGIFSILILSGCLLLFVTNSTAIFVFFLIFVILPSLEVNLLTSAVVGLFPTHLRGKALGFSMSLGSFAVVCSEIMVGYTLQVICAGTLAIFSLVFLTCGVLVYFYLYKA